MASRASLHMLWMWELSCHARLRLTATLMVSCSSPFRSSAKRMAWGFFCTDDKMTGVHALARMFILTPVIKSNTCGAGNALPIIHSDRLYSIVFAAPRPQTILNSASQHSHPSHNNFLVTFCCFGLCVCMRLCVCIFYLFFGKLTKCDAHWQQLHRRKTFALSPVCWISPCIYVCLISLQISLQRLTLKLDN